MDNTTEPPQNLRFGIIEIPSDSSPVTDADEEVFLLYTRLASAAIPDETTTASFRGLGHVDSKQDILPIEFILTPPVLVDTTPRRRREKRTGGSEVKSKTIRIDLVQDKTALRSRKGDTGSVLWRASVDFAQMVLQQHHLPSSNTTSLFPHSKLANAYILELGAGTGLLSIALSPLVRRYTVTDIPDLLPLIRKNLTLNFPDWAPTTRSQRANSSTNPAHRVHQQNDVNVVVDDLDWIALSSSPPHLRHQLLAPLMIPDNPPDVLLLVDCIYNPSLLPPLIATLDILTVPGKTAVLVVVELRAEDVVRTFLDLWLKSSNGTWDVWDVEGALDVRYAVWVGWKGSS